MEMDKITVTFEKLSFDESPVEFVVFKNGEFFARVNTPISTILPTEIRQQLFDTGDDYKFLKFAAKTIVEDINMETKKINHKNTYSTRDFEMIACDICGENKYYHDMSLPRPNNPVCSDCENKKQ